MEFEFNPIIAAVRNEEELENAVKSDVDVIFYLSPSLFTLENVVKKAHNERKKIFIHIDLADGIGKDKSGIMFAKNTGVDGIISTKINMIREANEIGLTTVQRFFIIDSHSVDTTVEALKTSKADMIEVMPGVVYKVIKKLKNKLSVPVISGGLIDEKTEIYEALKNGASAISTGKTELWNDWNYFGKVIWKNE